MLLGDDAQSKVKMAKKRKKLTFGAAWSRKNWIDEG